MDNAARIPIDNLIAMSRVSMDFRTMIFRLMMTRHFRRQTRFRMAVRFVISQVGLHPTGEILIKLVGS